ncbi:MAG: hypothetical protein JWM19_3187 [Actinomycetia bacterium]|nr:hypothetical protein [Actinomycetes bacterium]
MSIYWRKRLGLSRQSWQSVWWPLPLSLVPPGQHGVNNYPNGNNSSAGYLQVH